MAILIGALTLFISLALAQFFGLSNLRSATLAVLPVGFIQAYLFNLVGLEEHIVPSVIVILISLVAVIVLAGVMGSKVSKKNYVGILFALAFFPWLHVSPVVSFLYGMLALLSIVFFDFVKMKKAFATVGERSVRKGYRYVNKDTVKRLRQGSETDLVLPLFAVSIVSLCLAMLNFFSIYYS